MLRAGDRERCGREIDLRPLQVAKLGSPQPVPEREQDHGRVPVRPAIAPAAFNQLLDLASVRYSRVRTSTFFGGVV